MPEVLTFGKNYTILMIRRIKYMFFLKMSSESKVLAEQVKFAKRKYPSLKVVGRGTVSINPSNIVSSESFKVDASKVANLTIKA